MREHIMCVHVHAFCLVQVGCVGWFSFRMGVDAEQEILNFHIIHAEGACTVSDCSVIITIHKNQGP